MLSDRLRSRLAELNREPLPAVTVTSAPKQAKPSWNGAPEPIPTRQEVIGRVATANAMQSFGREVETPLGKHWIIQRPISALWDRADRVLAEARKFGSPDTDAPQRHADWQDFAKRFPGETLFIDLETCGFAGAMIFLVGVIHTGDDGLVISQILARNYAEEAAMLYTLWQITQRCEMLLSFNGKSFDWPMVNDRSVLHRLDVAGHTRPIDQHIDLLHHARRRYRHHLPNCKLQTLEWYLCGRRRAGDIPGSEIPDAYHQYVRTGDNSEMKSILHHNALDLVTLLQLSLQMATA